MSLQYTSKFNFGLLRLVYRQQRPTDTIANANAATHLPIPPADAAFSWTRKVLFEKNSREREKLLKKGSCHNTHPVFLFEGPYSAIETLASGF